jgi:predicted DNA binding CopG/RHH family protein
MRKIKYIDSTEKELIESYNDVDKRNVKKLNSKDQSVFKKAAKNYLRSQTKMNIRIDQNELNIIKQKAALDGLKYQTFVKSIIHKYITGQLIEKKYR